VLIEQGESWRSFYGEAPDKLNGVGAEGFLLVDLVEKSVNIGSQRATEPGVVQGVGYQADWVRRGSPGITATKEE